MAAVKKSLCIFTHFSELPVIPHYVTVYVNELSNHFDNVIIAANKRDLKHQNHILNKNVTIWFFENEGYDMGLFYKVFQTIHPEEFSQIACVNDSNILFNKLKPIFEWSKKSSYDFWGLIDSDEKPWFSTNKNNYHIQSYFIVFNVKAIKSLESFLKNLDINTIFREKDSKKLRRLVIDQWEIGLTQYLLNDGLKSDVYINSHSFLTSHESKVKNITHSFYKELISNGYPLLKKKVALKKNWRTYFGKQLTWEKLLKDHGCSEWNIPLLIENFKKLAG